MSDPSVFAVGTKSSIRDAITVSLLTKNLSLNFHSHGQEALAIIHREGPSEIIFELSDPTVEKPFDVVDIRWTLTGLCGRSPVTALNYS